MSYHDAICVLRMDESIGDENKACDVAALRKSNGEGCFCPPALCESDIQWTPRLYCTPMCGSKESDKYRISALELLSRSVGEIGKPHIIVNIR